MSAVTLLGGAVRLTAVLVFLALAGLLAVPSLADPPAAGAAPQAALRAADPSCRESGRAEVLLPQPFPGDTLALPHRLIVRDSFTLRQGETDLRDGVDFELLVTEGSLLWRGAAPRRSPPLVARYRYLPLAIAGRWGRTLMAAAADTLVLHRERVDGPPPLPSGARLEIGGSKTFSVEFGNRRDLSLEQSLDLNIRGQLAEGVQVRAILTDRRTPLQPEGTTGELSDLDQVLVEVESPWGELRLGDLSTRQEGFRFLAHQREMEGLLVNAHVRGRHHATAAVGRGLGDHRSVERFGIDGLQGPYDLLEQQPGDQSVLVAGSERVWLDGVRMERGAEHDYIIDYGTGELWFTMRRVITAVSEIRVDYQVRQGAFEREYYSFGAASGENAGALALAWLRERDNPEHSPLFSLDDEERAALAAAGDSVTAALAGGVVKVEIGAGDYEAVEVDTLEAPFFVYVGPADPEDPARPGGSYRVSFADVGEGRGDYADSISTAGETVYYFVGHRLGRYLPGRSLPLPKSLDLLALRGAGEVAAGLTLEAEGALSWNDGNVLSQRDDQDNAGAAFRLGGGWQLGQLLGGPADLLALRFGWRRVDPRFVSPERLDPAFTHRRWNASSEEVLDGHDRRGSVGLALRPTERLLLEADWERLHAPERFRGERWHARVARRGRLSADAELWRGRSREAGELRRSGQQRAAVRWTSGVELAAEYDAEQLLGGAAGSEEGEDQHTLRLRAALPGLLAGWRAALTAQVRWDRSWESGVRSPAGRRRLYQLELGYARSPTMAELRLAHRASEQTPDASNRSSDLLDWVLTHRPARGVLQGEWRGRVTTAAERQRIGQLLEVGNGGGHYDSLGNYVGQGDYDFYYVRADSAVLETQFETVSRWTLKPFVRAAEGQSPLRGLEATLYGRLEIATAERLGRLLGDAGRLLRGDAPTRRHVRLVRCDLSWRGRPGLPTPQLGIEESVRRERTAGAYGRLQHRQRGELELRWTLRSGITVRGRAEASREWEGVVRDETGEEFTDELLSRGGSGEITWKMFHPITLRLGLEGRLERFLPEQRRRTVTSMQSALILELRRALRAEFSAERRWSGGDGVENLPFVTKRPGWRLAATAAVRPKSGVTGSVRLQVSQDEGRSTVTSGRMEVRAFF